jgi:hypothetical protein
MITCVCFVVFMTPPGPLSNSTLTPSNSTKGPLVTLEFDEVGGGCLILTIQLSDSFYFFFFTNVALLYSVFDTEILVMCLDDVEGYYNLGITISPAPMDVLLDEVSGRVYFGKKRPLSPLQDLTVPPSRITRGHHPQKKLCLKLCNWGVRCLCNRCNHYMCLPCGFYDSTWPPF